MNARATLTSAMNEFTLLEFALSIIGSVIVVGIALAAFGLRVVTRLEQRLERRIDQSEQRIEKRIDRVEESLSTRIANVEQGQAELRERMARLEAELRERLAKVEGLLEGLREAITGRRVA